MVVVRLKGGLGNQMFQYAAAKSLAGEGRSIYLDHSFLKEFNQDTEHFTARNYELGIFENIRVRKAGNNILSFFLGKSLFIKTVKRLFNVSVCYVEQMGNEYIPFEGLVSSRFSYLEGYFQSEKYFSSIRAIILNDFEFPRMGHLNEDRKELILHSENTVSVHIRRGDYLKSPVIKDVHGVLGIEYYHTALTILQEKYGHLNVFVFSDDMDWARENLKQDGSTIYFVDGNKGVESWKDMALMSFCRHHIIANSSFSWWGAWLSGLGGETFAPRNWYNSQISYDIRDFIPGDWNIVDNA